jgi:hypothetical protein
VADQGAIFEVVFVEELFDVEGKMRVIMDGVVRRFAMVAEVLVFVRRNCMVESLEKLTRAYTGLSSCFARTLAPIISRASIFALGADIPYLLILLLFFFDPKRPCRNIMAGGLDSGEALLLSDSYLS